MTKPSRLKKDDLDFSIRTSELIGEEYDWSRDNRFWDVEMLQPALAFRGIPKAVVSTGGTKKIPHGKMLKKQLGWKNLPRFLPQMRLSVSLRYGSRRTTAPAYAVACFFCP